MKIKRYITEARVDNVEVPTGPNASLGDERLGDDHTQKETDNSDNNIVKNNKGKVSDAKTIPGTAGNIEKIFKNVDSRKPKDREQFRKDLAEHVKALLKQNGEDSGDNASEFIGKLPADFVQEFAKSIGKNALCYKDNLFLNMMDNKDFEDATSDSKSTFERIYNLVISMDSINNTDGLEWIRSGLGNNGWGCILYLPELWKNIDDSSKLAQIINHDFKLYTAKDDAQQTPQSESLIIEANVNDTPHQQLIKAIQDRSIDNYIVNTIKEPIARTGNDSEVALNSLKKVVASGNEDSLTGIFNNLTKDEPNSRNISQFIIKKYKENSEDKK